VTAVDEQGKPRITGYRTLNEEEIAGINRVKALEAEAAELWKDLQRTLPVDQRWLHIAKTDLEKAFMALGRAVARPQSPFEEDRV
jgi:hypothetical protein